MAQVVEYLPSKQTPVLPPPPTEKGKQVTQFSLLHWRLPSAMKKRSLEQKRADENAPLRRLREIKEWFSEERGSG
jgi:hypothetical protein